MQKTVTKTNLKTYSPVENKPAKTFAHKQKPTDPARLHLYKLFTLVFSSDRCSWRSSQTSPVGPGCSCLIVSEARNHTHITPVLTAFHWLSMHKRIMFKTAVLVWKHLTGTAPATSPNSAFLLPLLQVTRTWTSWWSFAVTGPSLWNSLPDVLCYGDQRLCCILSSNNWRPMSFTCDMLTNRRNIHHRLALLWSVCDSSASCQTAGLLTYLLILQYSDNCHSLDAIGGQGSYSIKEKIWNTSCLYCLMWILFDVDG